MGFERSVVAYRSKKTKRTSSRTRLSSFMAESETGRSDDFLASTAATSERERGETDDNRAARKLDRGEEQRRAQGGTLQDTNEQHRHDPLCCGACPGQRSFDSAFYGGSLKRRLLVA